MDVLGETADPRRAVLHRHADDPLEQRGRDDQVGFFAGQVQAQTAQALEDQVEDVGDENTGGQHPQGGGGLVRHHAVVDVHHEQRRGHGNQVDQETGSDGIGVEPARTLEGVAKPRTGPRDQGAVADVEFVLGLGKKHFTDVIIGQGLTLDDGFTAIAFAEQHLGLVFTLPAEQHGTPAVLEQQQRRHGNRGDRIELALQQPALQAGTGRGPGQ